MRKFIKVGAPLIQLLATLTAIVLSYSALKQEYFTPFDPLVQAGIPGFSDFGERSIPPHALGLVLPVTLANFGDHPGCFWDFMARVSAHTPSQSSTWWFSPVLELKPTVLSVPDFRNLFRAYVDAQHGSTAAEPTDIGAKFMAATFAPALLPQKVIRETNYLFAPLTLPGSSPDKVMTINSLSPGVDYAIEVFVSASAQCSPQKGFPKKTVARFMTSLDSDDTASIKQGELLFLTDRNTVLQERVLMQANPQ